MKINLKNQLNFLHLFINVSLNHMSIICHLVSQPKNKLVSNNRQLFDSMNLLPIIFGVNLPPNPRGQNSTNSQINPRTTDKNKYSKVYTIKYYQITGLVHQMNVKMDYMHSIDVQRMKRTNGLKWQGPLILLL